ncbi:MAG: proA [Oscillospiraceae bacterium]|jgi:glutamate-5-semialdehyde dehydrogenase|nr:proA [Oscillospiraceae bacterium]
MSYITELGERAKKASFSLGNASTKTKNDALTAIAQMLIEKSDYIIEQNQIDIKAARENGIRENMVDRLMLDKNRIKAISEAVLKVVDLEDPIGTVDSGFVRPNGLKIKKVRVPIGVIGIIFESRPNVTVDAASLCLKTGNAVILRGGKEAIHSNKALREVMKQALEQQGLDSDCIILVEDTKRETATEMMQMNGYLDVLIPRGGSGLIQAVLQNATVPVIETGVGNCHIYVEKTADLDMAVRIVDNAKTSRPSVCNAAESLLVDKEIAEQFLPIVKKVLDQKSVMIFGCEKTQAILGEEIFPATDEEYAKEFNDYIISVKVVDGIDQAISHVNRFGTGHSEAIVTQDLRLSERFTDEVDAAAVYVNASTRFTDGGEFGFGAEIGISTQKLHARGPMGLKELTSVKYIINGNGQIR